MELYGVDPLDIPRVMAMAKAEADTAMQFGVNQALTADVQAAPSDVSPS
jgi:hypothetical protein